MDREAAGNGGGGDGISGGGGSEKGGSGDDGGGGGAYDRMAQLREELEMVVNAAFTEPDDQVTAHAESAVFSLFYDSLAPFWLGFICKILYKILHNFI